MILSGLVVGTLLWANPRNPYVWIVLAVTLGFGFVGFYDDYLKVTKQTRHGLFRPHAAGDRDHHRAARLLRAACGSAAIRCRARWRCRSSRISAINLGWFFVIFGALHRGRRRQCGEPHRRARRPRHRAGDDRGRRASALIAYLAGNAVFADYLQINYVAGTGELAVLCGALLGAGLGFLWFNAPPASIFMGDTGSLALGGMLGIDRGGGEARDSCWR